MALAPIRDRWGVDVEPLNGSRIANWIYAGLIERRECRLRPTVTGLAVEDWMASKMEVK